MIPKTAVYTTDMAYFLLTLAFVCNGLANVLLKAGSAKGIVLQGSPTAILSHNLAFLAGLFLFAVNAFFYFLALRTLPLSVAYPVMVAMSFIIVGFFAWSMFGERFSTLQLCGYALIFLGTLLVVYKSTS